MNNKLSILLVEDNVLNQRIVMFSLKKYKHEVDIANNGAEALDKFKIANYDVILMDIMMPVMDGLEATLRIRDYEKKNKLKPQTPIIALTANTMDNDREKCLSFGMNEFMSKPFEMEKLIRTFKDLNLIL